MANKKKITAFLPESSLEEAQKLSGLGITETLILALEEFKKKGLRQKLLKLRGKVAFDLDLARTRK